MMQRRPRQHEPDHLAFIRGRPCILCGAPPPSDPAHIKMADGRIGKPVTSNIGMKADDMFCLPLCRAHHDEQHSMPERRFWEKYGQDAVLLALALYAVRPDGEMADFLCEYVRRQSLGLMELH